MSELNWKDLWKQNYNNEGDCEGLEKFEKTVGFGSKTNATYIPWAVAERIFKLQDGTYELIKKNEDSDSYIEVDEVITGYSVGDDGVVTPRKSRSYFLNVKAVWQGQEHIERFPIQTSSGDVALSFTQNVINTSFQRAKTKAIANVSGIGYKWYENYQDDYEDDGKDKQEEKNKEKAKELEKEAKAKKVDKKLKEKEEITKELFKDVNKDKKEDKVEIVEEIDLTDGDEDDDLFDDVKKTEDKEIKLTQKDKDNYISEIKSAYISSSAKEETIKDFLKNKGTKKINDLTDIDLHTLYNLIK